MSLWEALVNKMFTRPLRLCGQARADDQHPLLAVGDLDLAAAFLNQGVGKPGGGGARRDLVLAHLADEDPAQFGIEHDPAPLGADDDIEAVAMLFGAEKHGRSEEHTS